MECALEEIAARFPNRSVLALSHGGPCEAAHRMLTRPLGEQTARLHGKQAGYTALYIFTQRDADGAEGWDAPVVADVAHLDLSSA